jgi:transposase
MILRCFKEISNTMSEKKAQKPAKAETGTNKSEEIRKVARAMQAKGEKPRPITIIAVLEKQGVEVSSPQVSMVLKRMGFRPRRRKSAKGARPVTKAAKPKRVSVDDLVAARKLVSHFGGTTRAIAALEALQQFEP